MKLTVKELAQVEDLIARVDVKLCAAGANLLPALEKPVSYNELVTRRRINIGKLHG